MSLCSSAALACACMLDLQMLWLLQVPDWIWKLVYLGSAVAVSSPFVLKLLLKDRFHMELHRSVGFRLGTAVLAAMHGTKQEIVLSFFQQNLE